mmetsp:Transcript_22689/g.57765  ORF Transcript_22689/g.57765 Transcript_22689/m.57765 type:complete len:243 (+) Transcript_22689:440-1168(+)
MMMRGRRISYVCRAPDDCIGLLFYVRLPFIRVSAESTWWLGHGMSILTVAAFDRPIACPSASQIVAHHSRCGEFAAGALAGLPSLPRSGALPPSKSAGRLGGGTFDLRREPSVSVPLASVPLATLVRVVMGTTCALVTTSSVGAGEPSRMGRTRLSGVGLGSNSAQQTQQHKGMARSVAYGLYAEAHDLGPSSSTWTSPAESCDARVHSAGRASSEQQHPQSPYSTATASRSRTQATRSTPV